MTTPLYVGSLGTIAEALRHAAGALVERGYPALAANVEADAAAVEALHAIEVGRVDEGRFREDEPTREIVPVLPPKKETP